MFKFSFATLALLLVWSTTVLYNVHGHSQQLRQSRHSLLLDTATTQQEQEHWLASVVQRLNLQQQQQQQQHQQPERRRTLQQDDNITSTTSMADDGDPIQVLTTSCRRYSGALARTTVACTYTARTVVNETLTLELDVNIACAQWMGEVPYVLSQSDATAARQCRTAVSIVDAMAGSGGSGSINTSATPWDSAPCRLHACQGGAGSFSLVCAAPDAADDAAPLLVSTNCSTSFCQGTCGDGDDNNLEDCICTAGQVRSTDTSLTDANGDGFPDNDEEEEGDLSYGDDEGTSSNTTTNPDKDIIVNCNPCGCPDCTMDQTNLKTNKAVLWNETYTCAEILKAAELFADWCDAEEETWRHVYEACQCRNAKGELLTDVGHPRGPPMNIFTTQSAAFPDPFNASFLIENQVYDEQQGRWYLLLTRNEYIKDGNSENNNVSRLPNCAILTYDVQQDTWSPPVHISSSVAEECRNLLMVNTDGGGAGDDNSAKFFMTGVSFPGGNLSPWEAEVNRPSNVPYEFLLQLSVDVTAAANTERKLNLFESMNQTDGELASSVSLEAGAIRDSSKYTIPLGLMADDDNIYVVSWESLHDATVATEEAFEPFYKDQGYPICLTSCPSQLANVLTVTAYLKTPSCTNFAEGNCTFTPNPWTAQWSLEGEWGEYSSSLMVGDQIVVAGSVNEAEENLYRVAYVATIPKLGSTDEARWQIVTSNTTDTIIGGICADETDPRFIYVVGTSRERSKFGLPLRRRALLLKVQLSDMSVQAEQFFDGYEREDKIGVEIEGSLCAVRNGQVVVSGTVTWGSLDGGADVEESDIVVFSADKSTLDFEWSRQFRRAGTEYNGGIVIDDTGSIMVAGYTLNDAGVSNHAIFLKMSSSGADIPSTVMPTLSPTAPTTSVPSAAPVTQSPTMTAITVAVPGIELFIHGAKGLNSTTSQVAFQNITRDWYRAMYTQWRGRRSERRGLLESIQGWTSTVTFHDQKLTDEGNTIIYDQIVSWTPSPSSNPDDETEMEQAQGFLAAGFADMIQRNKLLSNLRNGDPAFAEVAFDTNADARAKFAALDSDAKSSDDNDAKKGMAIWLLIVMIAVVVCCCCAGTGILLTVCRGGKDKRALDRESKHRQEDPIEHDMGMIPMDMNESFADEDHNDSGKDGSDSKLEPIPEQPCDDSGYFSEDLLGGGHSESDNEDEKKDIDEQSLDEWSADAGRFA